MSEHAAPVAVREILQRLTELESGFHFGPAFYSSLESADRARLQVAKRLAHQSELARVVYFEKLSLYTTGEVDCSFCDSAVSDLADTTVIGNRLLHRICADKMDRWLFSVTASGKAALSDPQDVAIEEGETRELYDREGWAWEAA